jgi:hypothetical protein
MTEGPGAKDAPHPTTDKERASGQALFGLGEPERQAVLAWVGENLPQVRSSVTTEPLVLVADLVYALGYALWTGVVVVVFVQVIPEAKRRQFKQALDAYEAGQRDQARAGSDQASGDDEAPTAR